MLLTVQNISKSHGLRTLFHGVCLAVEEGDRIGLIGPNGTGKSTLLRILAREEDPDEGTVTVSRGVRAVSVPQNDRFPDGMAARAVVVAAARTGLGDHADEHESEVVADIVMDKLGFDAAHAAAAESALSGGWRKRLSIARALASCGGEPDLVLLDEPTNHLDLDGIEWLESFLGRPSSGTRQFASVFVTHDRVFLENVATRVVELSPAYPQGTLEVAGRYSAFLRRREEFLEAQARAQSSLANQVRQDNVWLARGAQARRTKSKGRIADSADRASDLAVLRTRNAAAVGDAAKVDFAATGRRTRKLIAAHGIAKSFGGRTLFQDLDVELGRGDRLGLLGPNGSGKTTLLKVLTGELAADAGTVVTADPRPRVVVFSQHRQEVPPTLPLREALSPTGDFVSFLDQRMHVSGWARRFLFRDDQLNHTVSSLSGGELARLHLARLMLEPADVLVLDEPTNDLDIPTLEVLEEAIEQFPGAAVLVTHDRAMLDRLATQVLALNADGPGRTRLFASLDQALAAEAAAKAKAVPAAPVRTDRTDRTDHAASADQAGSSTAPARSSRRKLSFNEQREYDAIEQRILEAETRAEAAERRVNDPKVIADHIAMAQACEALEAAHAEVTALYARWQELESRKA